MSFLNKFLPWGAPGLEVEEPLPIDGGIIEIDIEGIPKFGVVDEEGNLIAVCGTRRSARGVRRMFQQEGL